MHCAKSTVQLCYKDILCLFRRIYAVLAQSEICRERHIFCVFFSGGPKYFPVLFFTLFPSQNWTTHPLTPSKGCPHPFDGVRFWDLSVFPPFFSPSNLILRFFVTIFETFFQGKKGIQKDKQTNNQGNEMNYKNFVSLKFVPKFGAVL